MKMVRIGCVLMMIPLVAISSVAIASDFSCGSKIITIGERTHDVLRKCGEPSYVEVWEQVRIRRAFGFRLLETGTRWDRWPLFLKELITVEEWEYNFGSNRFIRYLRFENGRLIRITEGDYGY